VGELPPAGAPLSLRTPPPEPAPTLENARALGVRVKVTDAKSSLRDVNNTLGTAMNVMNAVGYAPEAYRRFNDFRQAVRSGIVPEKKRSVVVVAKARHKDASALAKPTR